VTRPGRDARVTALLLAPAGLFLGAWFLLPLAQLFRLSLGGREGPLQAYREVLGPGTRSTRRCGTSSSCPRRPAARGAAATWSLGLVVAESVRPTGKPPGYAEPSRWRLGAAGTDPRRVRAIVLAIVLLAVPLTAGAQPTGKYPRIGTLRPGSPPDPLLEAFRQGLRELGYEEGRNIDIEYRWAEGREERIAGLVADLVRLKVDVIVAGAGVVEVAKRATATIPIVMPVSTDPVRAGLVTSLARPGGNITGLTTLSRELPGKWLELLKDTLPRVSRVAVLWDPGGDPGQVQTSEAAARSLGMRLHVLKVGRVDGFESAFAEARERGAEALMVVGSPLFYVHRARLTELSAKHRMPTIYAQREFVVGAGGLMSYGADYGHLFRRAATYVDKILKGAKPGDLPIEQPTKFELVINRRTAGALGLTIPPSVLARADEIIDQ
jgi:putative ABC transport system substrate-binding protein